MFIMEVCEQSWSRWHHSVSDLFAIVLPAPYSVRTLKVHYINKCFSASFFHSWREWRKNPRKRFVDFQSRNISYPEFFSCICAPNCKQSNSFNFFNNNFYCFNIFSILTIFFQLIQYFLCRLFENRFLCSLAIFYCFFGYFFQEPKNRNKIEP